MCGSGKISRVWDLTTVRSYANVLSPQDLQGFRSIYKHLEDLYLQGFRGIYKYSEAFISI
jgi:hypothetical protein